MDRNKFVLNKVIAFEDIKDSYSYQKSKEALEKFFNQKFDTEGGYGENDEEMYCYVLLTRVEYDNLNNLCRLVNINIEDYSPMKYFLPNDDIRYDIYSYNLDDLPNRYFNYDDFKKLRRRVIKELINRKLI